jgi:RNA polymerase sigma-70 factor, ECF subfamily
MEKGTPAAVEAHIPALRRFARILLRGDRERADDLVQDCLERALADWHKRQPDCELRGWLFTILFNRFVTDHRRRQREFRHRSLDELEEAEVPGSDGARERTLACRDLLRVFVELPQAQRTVLLLVGVEDFTYEETAGILGVPIGTVMSRLSRGRERLRRYMNEGRPSQRPLLAAAMTALTHPPPTARYWSRTAARCKLPQPGARVRTPVPPLFFSRYYWR